MAVDDEDRSGLTTGPPTTLDYAQAPTAIIKKVGSREMICKCTGIKVSVLQENIVIKLVAKK